MKRKNQMQLIFMQAATDFHNLYDKSISITGMTSKKPSTQTTMGIRRQRHYILDQLAQQVREPHVAECGVFKGASAYIIASRIKNVPNIHFHLFDSFKGLSRITEKDEITKPTSSFRCPLRFVKKHLQEFTFISYYRGWIPERFGEVEQLKFSLVHIDVDLYQPTYDALAFFYPRLQPKGMMAFDDYGTCYYPGARKAINEYLADKDDYFFMNTPAGEGILIKW